MLTQIDVVYGNELEEQALALPILGITTKDSLLIRKVVGLNPSSVDLFIGDFARDGGTFQGRRVGTKNIVMTIDLNPNPALGETVSGLRDFLYKIFMDPLIDADHLELIFHDDEDRHRYLYGYTESFETEIFEQETVVQISIMCPDPYFRDLAETVLTNEFGTWVTVPFTYTGTAETGFQAEIHIADAHPMLTIQNNNRRMKLVHNFMPGDIVNLNTMRGERNITYTRGGVTYPLVGKKTPESRWIELHSQNNTMTVYGTTPNDTIAGVKTLKYRASYWGV